MFSLLKRTKFRLRRNYLKQNTATKYFPGLEISIHTDPAFKFMLIKQNTNKISIKIL